MHSYLVAISNKMNFSLHTNMTGFVQTVTCVVMDAVGLII